MLALLSKLCYIECMQEIASNLIENMNATMRMAQEDRHYMGAWKRDPQRENVDYTQCECCGHRIGIDITDGTIVGFKRNNLHIGKRCTKRDA